MMFTLIKQSVHITESLLMEFTITYDTACTSQNNAEVI